jgi:hypothetical protein
MSNEPHFLHIEKTKTPIRRLAIAIAVAFFMACLLGRTEMY